MVSQAQLQIQAAYQHCANIVRNHYENFPVASLILPKNLRQPISVVYAFARSADDFADEGDLPAEQRLEQLNRYSRLLDKITNPGSSKFENENIQHDKLLFTALHDVITRHDLPVGLFQDLLIAFKQDVTKKRYQNFEEVLFYCKHSANPVGRLLLYLIHEADDINLQHSDFICTSLQLINFLQDIHQDFSENQRVYLPADEMQKYNVSLEMIEHQQSTPPMRELVSYQLQRAKHIMLQGASLGDRISGRFGLQLRMMINGGLQVLNRLESQTENVFARPRLGPQDWMKIMRYALLKHYIQ